MDDLARLLQAIYQNTALIEPIMARINAARSQHQAHQAYSQRDVLLIAYGDSMCSNTWQPLQSLQHFLQRYLSDVVSGVHLLPFFPYSSDDGFSIIDYTQVNYHLGDWQDVQVIGRNMDLMFDLVLNHCSRQSLWFNDFVNGCGEAKDYFIEADPKLDTSKVVRPRTSPLIVDAYTRGGLKHVWATFSNDQIDLNFANPEVLLKFIEIMLFYVKKGARFIRLDAVAFVWKQASSPCVHLPQTHAIVKLLRWVLEQVDPNLLLITETNVPHEENIAYFGQGDEAHLVYNFALPPLVLHALNRGNGTYLSTWANELSALPAQCNYLNFIASHDGIGVRAVESIIPRHEIDDLVDSIHEFGGFVSMKANGDGTQNPYELNISLFDALQGTRTGGDQWQVERFLCSQLILLSMQGIPAIYIHSLTATSNDYALVEQTGRTRSINRHRWQLANFEYLLEQAHSPQAQVFSRYCRYIKLRRQLRAFHPQSPQRVFNCNDAFFILQRGPYAFESDVNASSSSLLCVFNLTRFPQYLSDVEVLPKVFKTSCTDKLSGENITLQDYELAPYQVLWLQPNMV